MANFLSGVSAGAHQGLASLVSSKRADRAAKRDQRRYEGELMLRLGEAKSTRDYRNKMFAYQKSRDDKRDAEWAALHDLRIDEFEATKTHQEATLAETIAARKQQGEQFEAAEAQDAAQFEANLAQELTMHDERMTQSRDEAAAERVFRQGVEINRRNDAILDRMDRQNQQRITEDYYKGSLRLQEQKLNQTQDPLERAKIVAEINRIKAQTRYYKAQTDNVGATAGANRGRVTFAQGNDIAVSYAAELAKEYTDEPWWAVGALGKKMPWTDPSGKKVTQIETLTKFGSQVFAELTRRFGGDTELASLHLPTVFDAMLADEKFGVDLRNDIVSQHTSPELTDREKIMNARQMFVNARNLPLADLLSPTNTGTPGTGTSIRDMEVPDRNQHDFRNRGVR